MAIIVEHDKRKHDILEKSLELFCREGFDDVTFQKIADACGITRTTLYIYFKNKKEIFIWTIKQMTSHIEEKLVQIIKDNYKSSEKSLRLVLEFVADACLANRQLFSVLLVYLVELQKSGHDPEKSVRRRVLRIRHILTKILLNGEKNGEFKINSVKEENDLFYSLIETAIFEIAVLAKTDVSDVKRSMNLAVDRIAIHA